MSNPLITINLVVLNGEKYVRHCLDSIKRQAYLHNLIEINIWDNGSTDLTKPIIEELAKDFSEFAKFKLYESEKNLSMWGGQEKLLNHSEGKYILALAVDVMLDQNFIKNAVEVMEKDDKFGSLEAKIYKYDFQDLSAGHHSLPTDTIDTCGFQIFKSRRVINIGHGEPDSEKFSQEKEIFGVEGAAPFFRKSSLENSKIRNGDKFEFTDHDFFWYGDDVDFAWRMRLFGWKAVFAPSVIAWHDRQSTKSLRKNWGDFIQIRRQIPIQKRRLDWRNLHFTFVKNDYIINYLKDLPWILKREIPLFGYIILFEPQVLLEIPAFFHLLPKMLRKRKEIMRRAVVGPKEIRKWFKF